MLNHKFLQKAVDETAKTFKQGDTFKNKEGDVFVLADDGQTWIPIDMIEFRERKCDNG